MLKNFSLKNVSAVNFLIAIVLLLVVVLSIGKPNNLYFRISLQFQKEAQESAVDVFPKVVLPYSDSGWEIDKTSSKLFQIDPVSLNSIKEIEIIWKLIRKKLQEISNDELTIGEVKTKLLNGVTYNKEVFSLSSNGQILRHKIKKLNNPKNKSFDTNNITSTSLLVNLGDKGIQAYQNSDHKILKNVEIKEPLKIKARKDKWMLSKPLVTNNLINFESVILWDANSNYATKENLNSSTILVELEKNESEENSEDIQSSDGIVSAYAINFPDYNEKIYPGYDREGNAILLGNQTYCKVGDTDCGIRATYRPGPLYKAPTLNPPYIDDLAGYQYRKCTSDADCVRYACKKNISDLKRYCTLIKNFNATSTCTKEQSSNNPSIKGTLCGKDLKPILVTTSSTTSASTSLSSNTSASTSSPTTTTTTTTTTSSSNMSYSDSSLSSSLSTSNYESLPATYSSREESTTTSYSSSEDQTGSISVSEESSDSSLYSSSYVN